jgi:hypothetical protein
MHSGCCNLLRIAVYKDRTYHVDNTPPILLDVKYLPKRASKPVPGCYTTKFAKKFLSLGRGRRINQD